LPQIDHENKTIKFNNHREFYAIVSILEHPFRHSVQGIYDHLREEFGEFEGYQPAYLRNRMRRRIKFLEDLNPSKGVKYKEEELLALRWTMRLVSLQEETIYYLLSLVNDLSSKKISPSDAHVLLTEPPWLEKTLKPRL